MRSRYDLSRILGDSVPDPEEELQKVRDRADRYEYALSLLRVDGDGHFVAVTRAEQVVVEDNIAAARRRRA